MSMREMYAGQKMHRLCERPMVYRYLPVRMRMPSKRNTAVEMIRGFVREGDASHLKPEGMRRL